MVNWTVTATTIYCEDIGDEVTILIYKDGSGNCTVVNGKQSNIKNGNVKCESNQCPRIKKYRDKLFAEESASSDTTVK